MRRSSAEISRDYLSEKNRGQTFQSNDEQCAPPSTGGVHKVVAHLFCSNLGRGLRLAGIVLTGMKEKRKELVQNETLTAQRPGVTTRPLASLTAYRDDEENQTGF